MPRGRKKILVIFVPLLIFLSFEMHHRMMVPSTKPESLQSPVNSCNGEIVTDTITALKYNKTFIISLFHDDRRQSIIRALAIVHYKKIENLYCWFCCSQGERTSIVRAAIDIHPERLRLPVGAADILCVEPESCSPQYMSIHSSSRSVDDLPRFEIKNRGSKSSFAAEFTLCLSVMHENYNNVLQFIQTMEMYKLFGAQKVFIYNTSSNLLMDYILNVYREEGTLEIIPWPVTSYVNFSSFWYSYQDWDYGKTIVLNDCIYRNMYRSKYVVLNDIGEIILPLQHLNWQNMISSLETLNPGTGIFFFESHFFSQNVFLTSDKLNFPSWKRIPGVNILQHIYREPSKLHLNGFKKMIVNPRSVVQVSIHSILKGYSRTLEVSKDTAILHSWRPHPEKDVGEKYLVRDTTIWRFDMSLISNVNKVIKKLFQKIHKSRWRIFLESIENIF